MLIDFLKASTPNWIFLWILIVHWVADFKMQTQNMSQNKSKSNYWLGMHVLTYTSIWALSFVVFWAFNFRNTSIDWSAYFIACLIFLLYTGVSHFATDYVTSRMTSKLYILKKYKEFFEVIGIDQILHYIQILTGFYYIMRSVIGY